MKMNLT
jgi:NAD-dependent SIR2 family protein deacetylase